MPIFRRQSPTPISQPERVVGCTESTSTPTNKKTKQTTTQHTTLSVCSPCSSSEDCSGWMDGWMKLSWDAQQFLLTILCRPSPFIHCAPNDPRKSHPSRTGARPRHPCSGLPQKPALPTWRESHARSAIKRGP